MKLTEKFLESQKEKLLAEKEKLTKEIKALKKYPDYGDIGDDNTQELVDYETNMSIDDQLELILKKINKALKSIENGSYGRCKSCQKEIESGRLEIMPYAELCVTCKEKNGKK